MQGAMMDYSLTTTSIMQHADRNHPDVEIVSVTADNPRHRYTYAEAFKRTRKLANALSKYGIGLSDRIGTLAWNDYRHFELYYAISGVGAITHTINPRLSAEQISYIINHAADRLLFVDPGILPIVENLKDEISRVEKIIVLTDEAHMPETSLENVQAYETFIGSESDEFEWPVLDENTACGLCYTSGTTGHPKGVIFCHRSNVLHSLVVISPDLFNFSISDVVMPVVPMFHVNAWGIPYATPLVGAKLVLPGAKMGDGKALHTLIEEEKVTFSAGVPTVWLGLFSYLNGMGKKLNSLQRVVIAGAACPLSIIDNFLNNYGVVVHHAWGMTEMSPIGTLNTLKPGMDQLPAEELDQIKLKQGRGMYGVEMKIVDDGGQELPWDGETSGLLKVKGPWVCSEYFSQENRDDAHDDAGWFSTSDVATIDPQGYMQITDRSKDVIKSGGEWISSIELENTAMNHPKVAEAAVIGVSHPRWTERPLLVVVKEAQEDLSGDELLEWFEGKVVKWSIPEDVVFVDELPHTATGKLQKVVLRKQFKDYRFPGV